MLQTSNYSLVLFLQFLLLFYDLFINSFSELLRTAPAVQLVLFIIQDIAILFNIIIIFLMFFNTFVFQAGLVNLLFHKFKGTILLSAAYLALSISFHVWVMVGTGRDNLVSPCDSCTNTGLEGSRPVSKNPPFLLGEAQRLQLRAAQEPALG